MRKLVLWGQGTKDYQEQFDLTEADLNTRILEFGCGANQFNVQQTEAGREVVSCDPLFNLDKTTLNVKVSMIFEGMVDEIYQLKDHYDFDSYGGFEALVAHRMEGVDAFLADYSKGKTEGRYVAINDNALNYEDNAFDIAVVSHYLFAELDRQTVDFHLAIIRELARVAKEVRIFPLIDREERTSEFLGPVLLALQQDNYGVEVREVAYHLFNKGNAMLRVWANECKL